MSIEFSQELDAAPSSPALTGLDAGEVNLRPKLLADYTGQGKAKGICPCTLKPPGSRRMARWTTPCCTAVRRDSARFLLASVIASEMGVNSLGTPPLKSREIWPPCSAT